MSLLHEAMNKTTETRNGAVTLHSSLNPCVDLFFTIGSARNTDIIPLFAAAYGYDREVALKIALWGRDIREGAGERKTFRTILKWLNANYPNDNLLFKIIYRVPDLGRWDDLLEIIDNKVALDTIILGLMSRRDSLCAKWMPRKGDKSKILREALKLSPKEYRKLLVSLSSTVEQKMCANRWESIEYGKLPSLAAKRYVNTFKRHDEERYTKYLDDLVEGKEKVNAGAIFPHDVIIGMRNGDVRLGEQQWAALPDYIGDNNTNILPVVDVSGSMMNCSAGGGNTTCLDVSIALGLYLSERLNGVFKDEFITFSGNPVLQKLHGSLNDRYNQLSRAHWEMNTNFKKVFELILQQAKIHNIPQSDMPSMVVVLSDMEFDSADCNTTNYEYIKAQYALNEYTMPKLVFWNLNARAGNVPCKFREDGVLLVSGFSPAIMKEILSGDIRTPEQLMLQIINKDRYKL